MTPQKFNHIASEHGKGLYRFALKMLGDSEAAKDMTQEALARLWENRSKVDPDKAKSWLFTTVYRSCLSQIERTKKFRAEDCLPELPAPGENPHDLGQILTESLCLLSDVQKSVLLLRDYEGYDYPEIAEILQITESNARLLLFRARQKLKVYLKQIEYII